MPDSELTISQMCAAFGVTPRTLRFYESKELLAPRRIGQRRFYGRRDRARLTLILRGKRFGFSLEEIRRLLDIYDDDGGPERQALEILRAAHAHLAELQARRAELDEVVADLRTRIAEGEAMLDGLQSRAAAE
ncbi:MAG: MerR family DNA-binding transcriptional regulator [Rhodobacteraceae bacterium]|nr:MerR family DNA-binding transcriptional regulator [Paracoccaceae bacterium]